MQQSSGVHSRVSDDKKQAGAFRGPGTHAVPEGMDSTGIPDMHDALGIMSGMIPRGRERKGRLFSTLQLLRLKVSFMVAASTGFGYLLARPVPDVQLLLAVMATFLLTAACSAVNQVQERDTDALFTRTRTRPLVTGLLTCREALFWAVASGFAGIACFWLLDVSLFSHMLLTACTIAIFISYNGLYTPLKRRTPFALLIGALPGAMPPVMGWLATGAALDDPIILFVFAVYYVWQVPHFWLRAEQDAHEYRQAGMPTPWGLFGEQRYGRILQLWYYAYLVAVLMLPVFPLMHTTAARVVLISIAGGMLLFEEILLRQRRLAFHAVNTCLLLTVLLVAVDSTGWWM